MSSNEAGQSIELAWRKASFCASGECVEVAQRDDVIMLRDSTLPHGPMLSYAVSDWRRFVRTIKAGLGS
jgi:hypothetical protein